MAEWERLPDHKTDDGRTLRAERAEIDGQTWYVGNIPPALPVVGVQMSYARRTLRDLANWLRRRRD